MKNYTKKLLLLNVIENKTYYKILNIIWKFI